MWVAHCYPAILGDGSVVCDVASGGCWPWRLQARRIWVTRQLLMTAVLYHVTNVGRLVALRDQTKRSANNQRLQQPKALGVPPCGNRSSAEAGF